jgi:hypothetical protein
MAAAVAHTRALMRDRARAIAAALARHLTGSGLEICVACGRDYVNPVEWESAGDDHWRMFLRCGDCYASREVTVSDHVAQRCDRELHRRTLPIARAVERLDLERMKADAETLIAALRLDLIDAADFAR